MRFRKIALTVLAMAITLPLFAAGGLKLQYVSTNVAVNSGQMNLFCRSDPIAVVVDAGNDTVTALDAKIFVDTGVFGLSGGYFSNFLSQWAFPLYDASYPYGFQTDSTGGNTYLYIEATATLDNNNNILNPIQGSGTTLVQFATKPIAKVQSGNLTFYYLTGVNGPDSNLQSGTDNGFVDILTGNKIVNGHYIFKAYPCVQDTDAPIITDYTSGALLPTDTFSITISDYTGTHSVGLNSTNHYRWSGSTVTDYPWTNYQPAPSDVDNQEGVNTGSLQVSFSGMTHLGFTGAGLFSGTPLLTGRVLTFTGFSTSGYMGPGNPLTRDSAIRGYTLNLLAMSGLSIKDNQVIQVTVTGSDNANQRGQSHTTGITFTYTITGFDTFPPYITSGSYNFSTYLGLNASSIALDAGPDFDTGSWTYRTNTGVILNLTANKPIAITTINSQNFSGLQQVSELDSTEWSTSKTLLVGDNFSGTVAFEDHPVYNDNVIGQTYDTGSAPYNNYFKLNVFWIDRTAPDLTGDFTGNATFGTLHSSNKTTYILSSSNTGDLDYTTDDEFIVTAFSGDDGRASTSANDAGKSFVSSGGKDTNFIYTTGFAMTHDFLFTGETRSGRIITQDRAGNLTSQPAYININTKDLQIAAIPGFRDNGNFSYTGYIKLYQASGADFTGVFTRSSEIVADNSGIATLTQVAIDSLDQNNYLVVMKTPQHLSAGRTGDNGNWLDRTGIDFSAYFKPGAVWSGQTIQSDIDSFNKVNLTFGVDAPDYLTDTSDRAVLVPGDINRNDYIGATDIAIINNNLTVGNGYSPVADINQDGYITSEDQAIALKSSGRSGRRRIFTHTTALNASADATASTSGFWLDSASNGLSTQ